MTLQIARDFHVGQPILAADPLSSGSSRLKGGCGQDWPPHIATSRKLHWRFRGGIFG